MTIKTIDGIPITSCIKDIDSLVKYFTDMCYTQCLRHDNYINITTIVDRMNTKDFERGLFVLASLYNIQIRSKTKISDIYTLYEFYDISI